MTNPLVSQVRAMEADHGPDAWPAVQMSLLSKLADDVERLEVAVAAESDRCAKLCDQVANGLDIDDEESMSMAQGALACAEAIRKA